MDSDRARKDKIAKLAVEIWHRRGRSFLKDRDAIKETVHYRDIVKWHSEGYHVWDIAEYIIAREENNKSEGSRDVA